MQSRRVRNDRPTLESFGKICLGERCTAEEINSVSMQQTQENSGLFVKI